MRLLRICTTIIVSFALLISFTGCSSGNSGTGDSTGGDSDLSVEFAQGTGNTEDVQLALEKMAYAHVAAMCYTDIALGALPSETDAATWEDDYDNALASWKRLTDLVAEYDAVLAETDIPADPSWETEAGSGESSSRDIPPDGSPLATTAARAAADIASLMRPANAFAADPSMAFGTGEELLVPSGPDGIANAKAAGVPMSWTYDSLRRQLHAEYDSLPHGDRLKLLGEKYGYAASEIYDILEGRRVELRQAYKEDAEFADKAAKVAKVIETGSDVVLFVVNPAGTVGKVVMKKMAFKAALRAAAKEAGRSVATEGALLALEGTNLAFTVADDGMVVFTGEGIDGTLAIPKDVLSTAGTVIGLKSLLSDPTSAGEPGNWKTVYGYGQTVVDSVSEADQTAIVATYEKDGKLYVRYVDAGEWKTATTDDPEDYLDPRELLGTLPEGFRSPEGLSQWKANPYTGTYTGAWIAPFEGYKDVPVSMTLTIEPNGAVSGSWSYNGTIITSPVNVTYVTDGTFQGVMDSSTMAASGSGTGGATLSGGGASYSDLGSGPVSLKGSAEGSTIAGTFSASGLNTEFTVTK